MLPTKRTLYRLLYDALVDIRSQGDGSNNTMVFQLADVFHNLPLKLDRLDRGETTIEDIMHELAERAARHGVEGWLHQRLSEIAKYHPETLSNEDASS